MMNTANETMHDRPLLSVREAVWALGVDQPAVCRAIRRGVLPLVKRHGRVAVPAAAVAGLLRPATPARDDGGDADECDAADGDRRLMRGGGS